MYDPEYTEYKKSRSCLILSKSDPLWSQTWHLLSIFCFLLCLFVFKSVSPVNKSNQSFEIDKYQHLCNDLKIYVVIFYEKILLISYCPFSIFLKNGPVYSSSYFHKTKRDRSLLFFIIDNQCRIGTGWHKTVLLVGL